MKEAKKQTAEIPLKVRRIFADWRSVFEVGGGGAGILENKLRTSKTKKNKIIGLFFEFVTRKRDAFRKAPFWNSIKVNMPVPRNGAFFGMFIDLGDHRLVTIQGVRFLPSP